MAGSARAGLVLALPPKAAAKLAKVAGLLASDQPGEVVAAAAAGTRILREHGLSWGELVGRPAASPAPSWPPSWHPPPQPRPEATSGGDWRADVLACQARADVLTAWEIRFLASLVGFVRLSAKQLAVLARLRERVRAAGGVA